MELAEAHHGKNTTLFRFTPYENIVLKGRFSSGLEGTSATMQADA